MMISDIEISTGKDLFKTEAILQSLRTIIFTKRGERLFRPTFGANLEDYLFQVVDDITALNIKATIKNNLIQDERVMLKHIKVLPFSNENCFKVKINVEFEGTPIDFNFNLKSRYIR